MERVCRALLVTAAFIAALLTSFRARRPMLVSATLAGLLLAVGAGCAEHVAEAAGPPSAPREPRPPIVEEREFDFEAGVKRIRQELGITHQPVAQFYEQKQPQPRRRVRRWQWESPAETRSRLWNVPHEESLEAAATGLLRICISEADGSEEDCLGIWQVIRNIRIGSCDRRMYRRITECDEENGETYLSVMRRAQKYALGVVKARSARQRWISKLELSCERPEGWSRSDREWDRQYGKTCPRAAELARKLVHGEDNRRITGARIIAWGGRCENKRGACDDPLACARGLARVPDLETHNAFWCRPGSRGCSKTIDPICEELGFRTPAATEARRETETADPSS